MRVGLRWVGGEPVRHGDKVYRHIGGVSKIEIRLAAK